MKTRFLLYAVILAALTCLSSAPFATADHGKGKGKCSSCDLCSHMKGDSWKSGGQGELDEKFFNSVYFLKSRQSDLGLSDEQIEKLETLKIDVKKDLIRKDAEIEVLALDVKSALKKDTIDTAVVHGLIDQKHELKKARAKSLVTAYAELKNMLKPEQRAELKNL